MACAECDSQHHAACSNAPHRHKSTAPTTATRNLPARLREAAAAADAADADDADATADATTAAIDDATLASTAKKKQKVGPNAGVVSSGPDGILKDDVSNPLGSNPDEAIAGGGCVAVAFTKHDIFSSKEEAVAALDAQRDEWESWTGPGRLRADQKCDAFLGKRGETWHRQIIQRAVKAAGYNYIIVPATELNSTGMFVIDGVANDRYLQGETEEKGKWVEPYELDQPGDNPHDNPHNWQHAIAVKGGKLCRTSTNVSMMWLHLVGGKPDPEKGFFIRIDKVYKLTKKARAA